jgi:sulfatase maturation enzyme AslB (radical SAM superfamily)
MKIRLNKLLRKRKEDFGGVIYIPQRDDFFIANESVFKFINKIPNNWSSVIVEEVETYLALAKLGICETTNPVGIETQYSGVGMLGQFDIIPKISKPLVINCFATSFCPLKCLYCHADDLMIPFRSNERIEEVQSVVDISLNIPSLVAVITGGDPLSQCCQDKGI